MQLRSKPRGAHGIEPETFRRRGQLLSRPPTTCDPGYPELQSSSKSMASKYMKCIFFCVFVAFAEAHITSSPFRADVQLQMYEGPNCCELGTAC